MPSSRTGVAVGIEPGAEPESDRQSGAADLIEREVEEVAALDPAELRPGHPCRGAGDGLTQAAGDARLADLLADLPAEPRREAATLRSAGSRLLGMARACRRPASPRTHWDALLACRALQRNARLFGSRERARTAGSERRIPALRSTSEQTERVNPLE